MANTATGQVQTLCVCRELGVTDKPRNSTCMDSWRFIPIEVIDLPGLIKGAFEGKGLGTQFLNVVSQADALLHVVDASGGVDEQGKITHPGMGNPVIDVYDIEEEMILWFKVAVDRALQRTKRKSLKAGSFDKPISKEMAGIGGKTENRSKRPYPTHPSQAHPKEWEDLNFRTISETLRAISKPTVIIV